MKKRNVAMFVLWDEEGRLLLQHRDKDAKRNPNYWAFFGGGIKDGETPEEAVKREAMEELGIIIKDFKFFKRYLIPGGERHIFTGKMNLPLDQLKKQQHEGQDLGLFNLNELKDILLSENDKIFLKELFEA